MKTNLIFGIFLFALSSCTTPEVKKVQTERVMDPETRKELQGVWFDRNSESPVLRIEGDSICYASKSDVRMSYKLVSDTLFVIGLNTAAYPVLHRTEHSLQFKTPIGDVMSLYKNENINLIIPEQPVEEAPDLSVKKEKDSIISYCNTRYRGYTYINPTTIKVVRQGMSEDGFSIDNVYYDNIIHICVFQGKARLCGKDIKKQHFEGVVPSEFLQISILENMDFIDVTEDGFVYRATLCVPDGPCYYSKVLIDRKNEIKVSLIQ